MQIARMLVERGHLATAPGRGRPRTQRPEGGQEGRGPDARSARPARPSARPSSSSNRPRKTFSGLIAQGRCPDSTTRAKVYAGPPRRDAPEGGLRLRAGPDVSRPGRRSGPKLLDEALKQFEDLYKDHREQMAGLTAQMWQAKCYEEKGEIGAGHRHLQAACSSRPIPGSAPLQRYVGYFYIVALAKRKEYALAADEADALAPDLQPPRGAAVPGGPGRPTGAGQGPSTPRCPRHPTRPSTPQAVKRIIDAVVQVVRYASPYKNEALALLKKYKPQRRDEGRGDRPAHLPGRHGAGRRGDRLARVGPGDRPAQGGRPQGRPAPRRSTRPTGPGTTWPSAIT